MVVLDGDQRATVRRKAVAGLDGGAIGVHLEAVETVEIGGVADLRAVLIGRGAAEVEDVEHIRISQDHREPHSPALLLFHAARAGGRAKTGRARFA